MAAHSRQISRPLVAAVCLVVLAGFPARAAEQLAFTDAPPAFTNATLATFSISWDTDKGSTECKLDESPLWYPCSSPYTLHSVSEGKHKLTVRAVGSDGAPIPGAVASHSWFVDMSPPIINIISGPAPATPRPSAKFVFSVNDMPHEGHSGLATVLCWLDGASIDSCTSPLALTGLGPSAHSFRVEVADAAGNVAASEVYSWMVRTTPRPTLAVAGDDSRCRGPVALRVDWSEPMEGFSAGSLALGGAAGELRHWKAESQQSFTATLVPAGSGEATVQVLPGSAHSAGSGAPGEASEPLRLVCDLEAPSVSVLGPASNQQLDGPFLVTFAWTELVSGFSPDRIALSGLPGARLEASWARGTVASRFRATVHPVGSGTLVVRVEAGAAEDAAGNANTAASEAIQLRVTGGQMVTADAQGEVAIHSTGFERSAATRWAGPPMSMLAAHPDGRVFAAQKGGSAVQAFDLSGQLLQTIAGFTSVSGLACSGSGDLYVADAGERRVAVLDSQLSEIGSLRAPGMQSPAGLALDGVGWLYVADPGAGAVVMFDAAGTHVGVVPFPGRRHDGAPACPTAVEIGGRQQVYVSCEALPSVEVFQPTGSILPGDAFAHVRTIDLSQHTPAGAAALALDRLGQLHMVVSGGGGLLVWSPRDGLRPQTTATEAPTAIAIFRDRTSPLATIEPPATREQSGPFRLRIVWSEPVTGFNASCVSLSGAGGQLAGLEAADAAEGGASRENGAAGATGPAPPSVVFIATVAPSAVGMLEVQVAAGCATDAGGNANIAPSNRVQVVYFGGQCSVNLGCSWRLAEYESQLAEQRLRLSVELEAHKERAKVAVQQAAEDARAARALEAEAAAQVRALEAQARLAEIEAGVVAERAAAEAEGRIREARENEGLRLRELAAASEARKEMVLASIAAVVAFLEAAGGSLLGDPAKMRSVLAAFGAAVLTFFVARELVRVLGQEIARLLSKPPLIRETSRSWLPRPAALLSWLQRPPGADKLAALFGDVVLERKLAKEVGELAQSVALATARGVPLRNVLLWGPPGTGKTMAAQRLARGCGMGYAMMSGGDVVPLGRDAVSELHKIFDWAEASAKGVLLFIDEADAFLRRRQPGDADSAASEQTRAAINAVLARTGTQSTRFMLVLASNRPEDLDAAVLDRIDDTICFPLPGVAEREGMLKMYFQRFIGRVAEAATRCPTTSTQLPAWSRAAPATSAPAWQWWASRPPPVDLHHFSQATFRKAAECTEGFSGRELAKLMTYVQCTVYGSPPDPRTGQLSLSAAELMGLVERKVAEHRQKGAFAKSPGAPSARSGSAAGTVQHNHSK